jgi:hypothetical protein
LPGDIIQLGPNGELNALTAFGDTPGGMEIARHLEQIIHQSSDNPLITKDQIAGQLSGVALKMLYGDHEKFIKTKRITYGYGMQRMVMAVLTMMGHRLNQSDITISWPDIVPMNELEAVTIAEKKLAIGYSEATVIRDTGGNPDEQAAQREEEDASKEEAAMAALDELEARGAQNAIPDTPDTDEDDQ